MAVKRKLLNKYKVSYDCSIDPKEFKHFFRNMLVEIADFPKAKLLELLKRIPPLGWLRRLGAERNLRMVGS
jgi:hypothetical protein